MLYTTILAYLDPGTGSMLVQLLVGGVAAAGVALKLYWHKFLRLLRIRKDDVPPSERPTRAEAGDGPSCPEGVPAVRR